MSNEKVIAICGLNCKECPQFPEECGGCLSDRLSKDCIECAFGFRVCAKEHNVERCNDCSEFPCERIAKVTEMQNEYGFMEDAAENLRELNR